MKTTVDRCQPSRFSSHWLNPMKRRFSLLVCVVAIALSGCVKYDTGINFDSFNDGRVVQHIQLSDRLNSFNSQAVKTWIDSIEARTSQAQGRLERLSDREFEIVIPFASTQELVTKINRFFNTQPTATNVAAPQFFARLQIEQSNWLAIVKNHLTYDLDLRAIAIPNSDTKVAISANNFVDLNFRVDTPWGIQDVGSIGRANSIKKATGSQTTWQLQPGRLNRIDAVFWLPNPLGIGAIVISLVSILGYYLKYRQLPGQQNPRLANPVDDRRSRLDLP